MLDYILPLILDVTCQRETEFDINMATLLLNTGSHLILIIKNHLSFFFFYMIEFLF